MSSGVSEVREPPALARSVDAVIYGGAGLITLLIGSWVPDPRLDISGIPIGIAFMAMALVLVYRQTAGVETLRVSVLLLLPLLLLGVSLFWSPNVSYGLDKLSTVVLSGYVGFLLFAATIDRIGWRRFCQLLAFFLLLLLSVAVVYKTRFGFFDRGVSFFVSGPIVFGRLMAIGCILALASFKGGKRFLIAGLFALAVGWTQSRGPILALGATLVVYTFFALSLRGRVSLVAFMGLALLGLLHLLSAEAVDPETLGRLGVLLNILAGDLDTLSGASGGSLGVRFSMWQQSIGLIERAPLGVGVGGWGSNVAFYGEKIYPHNLFLELWTEGGIFLGTLSLIPFCAFLFAARSVFFHVALLLLLAQMVSGDIADARFLLVFSLLSALGYQASTGVRRGR